MTVQQAIDFINQMAAAGNPVPTDSLPWQVLAQAARTISPEGDTARRYLDQWGVTPAPDGSGVVYANTGKHDPNNSRNYGASGADMPWERALAGQTSGVAPTNITTNYQERADTNRRISQRGQPAPAGVNRVGPTPPPGGGGGSPNPFDDGGTGAGPVLPRGATGTYANPTGAPVTPGAPANPNNPTGPQTQVPAGYFLRDLGVTEAGLGELDPYTEQGSAQILRLILGNNNLLNTPLGQYLADDARSAAILNLILGNNLLAGTPGRAPLSRTQQLMGMEDILERSYKPNKSGSYYDPNAILQMGLSQAGQYPLGSGGLDDVTGGYQDQADLVGYAVAAAAPYMDPLSAAHLANTYDRARQSYDERFLTGSQPMPYMDYLRQLGIL